MNSDLLGTATLQTILLSLMVALSSGALGFAFAWCVTRTHFPGRTSLSAFLSIPYAVPAYLLAMAWMVLGNPRVGLLKDFLPDAGVTGFWGVWFVEMLVAFSFPYQEMKAAFSRLDHSLEEAARIAGASPRQILRQITLPLLWPSLLNGMTLAFLYTLSSFGVPAILGMPDRFFVLTTLLYSQLKVGGLSGLPEALRISAILLALAIAALSLSGWARRAQARKFTAISGSRMARHSSVELGRGGRYLITSALSLWLILSVVLPWIALTLGALAPIAGRYAPETWTLQHFAYVLGLADFKESLFNSLWLTAGVTVVLAIAGFWIGYANKLSRRKSAQVGSSLFSIPFALPGSLIALFLILSSSWLGSWIGRVQAPLLLLALAYLLKYAALSLGSFANAFQQIHPSVDEAARVFGAGTLSRLGRIWAPLLRPTFFATAILTALPIFTELTMSILLTGPGASTLGTLLFQLREYADPPSASALAWMIMTVALLLALIPVSFTLFRRNSPDA